jgi:serine/threonine protein kinase
MKTKQISDIKVIDPFVTREHKLVRNGDPLEAYKGDQYGHCIIESFIGVGGAGAVYLAKHKELGVYRAIKILRRDMLIDSRTKERFLREARLSASLDHPNIVRVHHAAEENGRLFIEMEYVDGFSLRKLMEEKGKIPFNAVLSIGEQVTEALKYIHSLGTGIVHRDVKPENILVRNDGQIKLTDFGIARCEGLTSETVTGTIVGTCGYMPLEQIDGKPLDGRSDLYSLSVVLYEMVAGLPPYEGDTLTAIIRSIMASRFKPIKSLVANIPSEIDTLISSGLKQKAANRPANADIFLKTIRKIRESYSNESISAVEETARWLSNNGDSDIRIKNKTVLRQPVLFLILFAAVIFTAQYFYTKNKHVNVQPCSVPNNPILKDSLVSEVIDTSASIDTIPKATPVPNTQIADTAISKVTIKKTTPEKRIQTNNSADSSTMVTKDNTNEKAPEQPVHLQEFNKIMQMLSNGSLSKESAIIELKRYIKEYGKSPEASGDIKAAKEHLMQLLNR